MLEMTVRCSPIPTTPNQQRIKPSFASGIHRDIEPMDIRQDREQNPFSNGLIQLILGAVIMWMGKTTWEQSSAIAALDMQVESFIEQQHNMVAEHTKIQNQLDERTQLRFTRTDGEKMSIRSAICATN